MRDQEAAAGVHPPDRGGMQQARERAQSRTRAAVAGFDGRKRPRWKPARQWFLHDWLTGQSREGPSVAEKAVDSTCLQPNVQLLDRIRGEYLETPGLKLTLPQAPRLWHLREEECEGVLGALIDAKFSADAKPQALAVETPDLGKDGAVRVGVLTRVVDQASDRLANIWEAIRRRDLLEKFNLTRLELNRARTLILHRRSPSTRSTR